MNEIEEINRLRGIIESQNAALKHWRAMYDQQLGSTLVAEQGFERRAADWVRSRIGEWSMNRKERAMRLLEEACELAQAEGITWNAVVAQVHHVFQRPPGEPAQEAGGVAVTLSAWLASAQLTFRGVVRAELERIEQKPLEDIRGSLARKADADLVHGAQR